MSLISHVRNMVKTWGSSGQTIPAHWPVNWFQLGYSPAPHSTDVNAAVYAAMGLTSRAIARMPVSHVREHRDGAKEVIHGSNIAGILRRPNDLQTWQDFIGNVIYSLLSDGNAYWLGDSSISRDLENIYLLDPRMTRASFSRETGDVFYQTSGQFFDLAMPGIPDDMTIIPARYVGHLRMFTPRDPLIGVSPIEHAAASIAAGNAITNQQAAFFNNMSRPSGVLTTDTALTKEQMIQLREAWKERSKGMNSGGIPILSAGMKWTPMSVNSNDAQMIDAYKMTVADVARAFGIPQALIGSTEDATLDNISSLISLWLSISLGHMVELVESTLTRFFDLPADQKIELDTNALLRLDMKARMEALGEAVSKGILAPNEARRSEGYPPVEGGDMPRVQQQMVPVNSDVFRNPTPVPAAPAPMTDDEKALAIYQTKQLLEAPQ